MSVGAIQFSAVARNAAASNLILERAFSPVAGRGAPVSARTNDRPAESTSDYYHTDGLYSLCAYDLNAMGTWGQTIATTVGYRYVWIIAGDHPCDEVGQEGGWGRDALSFYAAFSNDPAVLPDPSTMYRVANCDSTNGLGIVPGSSASDYVAGFNNFLLYNPDEATNNAYLYVGSMIANGLGENGLHEVLVSGPDFGTAYTPVSVSHDATQGLVAYQIVSRLSSVSYESWGFWDPVNNTGQVGKWLSSDGGHTFARTGSQNVNTVGLTDYSIPYSTAIPIGGTDYKLFREDARGSATSSASASPSGEIRLTIPSNTLYSNGDTVVVSNVMGTVEANGTWTITKNASNKIDLNGSSFVNAYSSYNLGYVNPSSLAATAGQYATLVAVSSSTGQVSSSPAQIRVSDQYDGVFTIPFDMTSCNNYVQSCRCIVEDGVIIVYTMVCFPGDVGVPSLYRNSLPESGGGTNCQFIDVYGMVLPGYETAATASAPFGAKAVCSSGVVTMTWFDLPSGRTYRVKRFATSSEASTDTNGTTVGDVTGTSITNSPTVGSVYYYRIWSLSSGATQGSRIVNTYVS